MGASSIAGEEYAHGRRCWRGGACLPDRVGRCTPHRSVSKYGIIAGTRRLKGSANISPQPSRMVSPIRKELRRRNKAHLVFVGAQPCLICQRCPCDAHHLKFAQPRALGAKVSDEFTVPLCREHHFELHRHGNEMAWWANLQIAPLEAARELWEASALQADPEGDKASVTTRPPHLGPQPDLASDAESASSRNSIGRTSP